MALSPVRYISPHHGYIRYVPSLLQHNEDETLHVPQMGVNEGFHKSKCVILFLMSHLSGLAYGRDRKEAEETGRKGAEQEQGKASHISWSLTHGSQDPVRAAARHAAGKPIIWVRLWDLMATVSVCEKQPFQLATDWLGSCEHRHSHTIGCRCPKECTNTNNCRVQLYDEDKLGSMHLSKYCMYAS